MTEVIIYISKGEITNKQVIRNAFNGLQDGRYLLTLKNYKKRSLPQNAYLHGCIIPMVYEGLRNLGFDEVQDYEDAKFIIKNLFLKKTIVNKETGEMMEIVRKTSKLSTIEMSEFVESVIRWGAEYLSIQIPYPNEPLIMFAEYDQETKSTIIQK